MVASNQYSRGNIPLAATPDLMRQAGTQIIRERCGRIWGTACKAWVTSPNWRHGDHWQTGTARPARDVNLQILHELWQNKKLNTTEHLDRLLQHWPPYALDKSRLEIAIAACPDTLITHGWMAVPDNAELVHQVRLPWYSIGKTNGLMINWLVQQCQQQPPLVAKLMSTMSIGVSRQILAMATQQDWAQIIEAGRVGRALQLEWSSYPNAVAAVHQTDIKEPCGASMALALLQQYGDRQTTLQILRSYKNNKKQNFAMSGPVWIALWERRDHWDKYPDYHKLMADNVPTCQEGVPSELLHQASACGYLKAQVQLVRRQEADTAALQGWYQSSIAVPKLNLDLVPAALECPGCTPELVDQLWQILPDRCKAKWARSLIAHPMLPTQTLLQIARTRPSNRYAQSYVLAMLQREHLPSEVFQTLINTQKNLAVRIAKHPDCPTALSAMVRLSRS